MDDLVARVARSVDGAGPFDGVEDGADAPVAGGVDEALEAARVEAGEQLGELLRRVEGVAAVVGAARVRLQEGGGAGLDDVVDVQLERADPQPVVVVLVGRRREGVEVRLGGAARVEEGGDDPGAQPALVAGALEEGEVVEGVLRFDDGGDAEADGVVEALGEPSVLAVGRGPGRPRSRRARWPARERPLIAKSLTKPVGSPVAGR